MFNRLFNLRKSEFDRVLIFTILNLLLVAGVVLGSSAITSIFLKRCGIEYLPLMFLYISIATILVNIAYSKFSEYFTQENYLLVIISICSIFIFLLRIISYFNFSIIYQILYVVMEVINFVVFTQLWILIIKYFNSTESKRVFPVIATGGSFGGIISGLSTKAILKFVPSVDLLYIWCLLLFLCIPLITWLKIRCYSYTQKCSERKLTRKRQHIKQSVGNRLKTEFSSLYGIPMVKILIFLTIIGTFITFILDYQANKIFTERILLEDDLTGFLGLFSGIFYVISLLIQGILLSRIVLLIGVPATNFIFPTSTFISFVAFIVSPGLAAGLFGYFTRRYLKASFYIVTTDMLYNALHSKIKDKVRKFLKGYITPIASIGVSILLILNGKFLNFTILSIIGLAIAVYFLLFNLKLKKVYVDSLLDILKEGKLDFSQLSNNWATPVQRNINPKAILQALKEADEISTFIILDTIKEVKSEYNLSHILKEIYPYKSQEVKREIIRMLGNINVPENKEFLLQQYSSEESHIKDDILDALRLYIDDKVMEIALSEAVRDDNDIAVRKSALKILCNSNDMYYISEGLFHLKSMLDSPDKDKFISAVDVIKSLKGRRFILLLYSYFQTKKDSENKRCILQTMEQLETGEDEKYLNIFFDIFKYGSNEEKIIALSALKKIDSMQVIDYLMTGFDGFKIDLKLRVLEVYKTSKHFSIDLLYKMLDKGTLQYKVFETIINIINEMVARKQIDLKMIEKIFENNIEKIVNYTFQKEALVSLQEKVEILLISINEKITDYVKRLIMLIGLHSNKLDLISSILLNIFSDDKSVKANAMETLENVSDKNLFKKLQPLIGDEVSLAKYDAYRRQKHTLTTVLEENIFGEDGWLSACSIYIISRLKIDIRYNEQLIKFIREARASQDIYLREASKIVLGS